ncbi:helix-turn-helix transcriptional regulator [Legionella bononiensis]|uniref:Helix-turn-helix transcriptional regulator n=1 Tax=Legionella bononiensis TaxID=2793102 RepID=A0ABS1WFE0_9GAMM|nr:helix-turn-helix transcriptional regulator [Legionella bononiensis]MBL7479211.1 helix-turn-helix transcriptional regulator [Legionella bononiensis]MBL7528063.1 helix-turn-helix transcriptional regulator [Legionella bononiensis]MBL7563839.1 helix-turn-helix transcriptional regulator [Legionella bononiensis]
MGIKINSDHPTLALKAKINELCADFLKRNGLNYFQFLRCYDNGSIGLLTNNTGLIEQFQHVDNEPVVFSSFANEHQSASSFWFLWDEELPEMPVQFAREQLNIRNGITLVRRSKNYYDMIAVASPVDPEHAGAFYLNKLKPIEHFIIDFETANKELIEIMNKNPIALPEPYRDINYQSLCLSQGTLSVMGKTGPSHITVQELACLRLLIQGKSHKQIGRLLELSPRTVETYLQRVKLRTGFGTLHEMEHMIMF